MGTDVDVTGRARRPSFSVALIALIVLVTGVTGGVLGALAWREKRAGARALVDGAMAQIAQLTADHVDRFFRDAEPAVRLGPGLVAQGLLDPGNLAALERYVISVLRANPNLSWASYGDRDDRFVGAWRDAAGAVYVNRSFPRDGRIRLEEEQLLADGGRATVRIVEDHGYHPRERPYFRLAQSKPEVAWTDPYPFYNGALGITCVAPLLDAAGAVRGAFTADFSLERLSQFLDDLRVTPRSRVRLIAADGTVIGGPRPGREDPQRGSAEIPFLAGGPRADHATVETIGRDRERLLVRTRRFDVQGREWQLAVVVPERDLTEQIDAQARRAALLGAAALVLAAGAGIGLARWVARPLRRLGVQAQRIRDGDLAVSIVPESRDEIGTLARTMADMVQGLRDRDFIRDVLGRYVTPELAAECLRDRDAVRLGGDLRTVSILMSDLRGFSGLSERLGPQAMIALLNRYLACMVPIILGHRGTINEFIGDAILVLFGAPVERPDDAQRAVRCAWAMQRAMVAFNAESRAQGLPELTMGIGLHTGRVVAGNIGSPDRVKYGVVGPAVNLTGRIESLTVGPEILLSRELLDRANDVARVGEARSVSLKGIAGTIAVYELLGVVGEADASPPPTAGTVEVDLTADCYWLDGKVVLEPAHPVRVTRLDLRGARIEALTPVPEAVVDVKLVIDFGDGRAGDGAYARIAVRAGPEGRPRFDTVFTSLDEGDRRHIASLLAA